MAKTTIKKEETTRKTFVISEEDYKYILSLVYKKKMESGSGYTQKEALADIIKLHRQSVGVG